MFNLQVKREEKPITLGELKAALHQISEKVNELTFEFLNDQETEYRALFKKRSIFGIKLISGNILLTGRTTKSKFIEFTSFQLATILDGDIWDLKENEKIEEFEDFAFLRKDILGDQSLYEVVLRREELIDSEELEKELKNICDKFDFITHEEIDKEHIIKFWDYDKCKILFDKDKEVVIISKYKYIRFLIFLAAEFAQVLKAQVYDVETFHTYNHKELYIDILLLEDEHLNEHSQIVKAHDILYSATTPKLWRNKSLTQEDFTNIKSLISKIGKIVFPNARVVIGNTFDYEIVLRVMVKNTPELIVTVESQPFNSADPKIMIRVDANNVERGQLFVNELSRELGLKFEFKDDKYDIIL